MKLEFLAVTKKKQDDLRKVYNNSKLKFYLGDVRDYRSILNAVDGVDFIYHAAALKQVPSCEFHPMEAVKTNILGTANLLEALRKSPYKDAIIHVCASSEVFGRVSKEKLPINEECSFHPASPYAISKVGTDLVGRYYAEAYNMTIMTTRMFTHTGPRRCDVFSESTFAKQIAMIEG
jgi:GDPmannose 4,6-dehydratase